MAICWTQCKTSGLHVECANTELDTMAGEKRTRKITNEMGSRDMLAWPRSDRPKIETYGKKLERSTSANGPKKRRTGENEEDYK